MNAHTIRTIFVLAFLTSAVQATVSIRDTTWVFKQYQTEIALYDNGYYPGNGQSNCDGPCTVGNSGIEEIPDVRAKIIENDYLRIVIAPSIGGRVMSLYHKESGTEQFYHANVAVPYQGPANTFYYNYLIVHGGVLPTFPGPEHSRTWNQFWELDVVEDSPERGSIIISYLDDRGRGDWEFNPNDNFPVEKDSKLFCAVEIFLEEGSAAMGYRVHFENKNDHPIAYEYWTLTTLAPGTELENTLLPMNTKILSPTKKVQLKSDWWSWLRDIITPAPAEGTEFNGGEISWFDKSSLVENWSGEGIMYAYPAMTKDWWGAINLDNSIGVLRIAPHQKTPGMKYWSWGYPAFEGSNPMPLDAKDENRSHIELWGGRSREFRRLADPIHPGLENAILWDEWYYPTFDLDTIHFANEFGALQIKESATGYQLLVSSTRPHMIHDITISGTSIEATAPAENAMIFELTEGCLEKGADVQVSLNGSQVMAFQEEIGLTGSGSCEVTIIQQDSEIQESSADNSRSSSAGSDTSAGDTESATNGQSSTEGGVSGEASNGSESSSSDQTSALTTENKILIVNGVLHEGSSSTIQSVTLFTIHGEKLGVLSSKNGAYDITQMVTKRGAYLVMVNTTKGNNSTVWHY